MFKRPYVWPIADAARCERPSSCLLDIPCRELRAGGEAALPSFQCRNRGTKAAPPPRETGTWRRRREKSRPGCTARWLSLGGPHPCPGQSGRKKRESGPMRAFIFPGQGSQSVGMGKVMSEASAAARDVLAEVDEALRQKLSRLMAEGPQEELTLTANAQPAIMANAIATLRASGLDLAAKADFVAGHSLGEYGALCGAGAFDLATTARLLRRRGEAMQAAVPVGEGAMAALLGANLELAQQVADAAAQGDICTVANDNDPSQVVISGHRGAV